MRPSSNRGVLLDTGFWIALFDRRDVTQHLRASALFRRLQNSTLLVPWPVHYELLRTRFVRRPGWVEDFGRIRSERSFFEVDDAPYRDIALRDCLSPHGSAARSLADEVIRGVLRDASRFRVVAFLSFNDRDFMDVIAGNRQIQLLPDIESSAVV